MPQPILQTWLPPKRAERPLVSLVVPVLNESGAVDSFIDAVEQSLGKARDFEVAYMFVDDGSTDDTLHEILKVARERRLRIDVIELTRNFGKEAALSAGLSNAKGDAVVPMDIDLQDPPSLLPEMIRLWIAGFDVVAAQRVDRGSDSIAKRLTAAAFYKVHNILAEPKIPTNVGDFRIMDRSVVDAINSMPESRRFMKGIFAWVGFRTAYLPYARAPRTSGSTKFNRKRLFNLAIEGLTSFSTAPLRLWLYLGVVSSMVALGWAATILLRLLISGTEVAGHATPLLAFLLIGGFQLLGIGIIGEYTGRMYSEAKRRPPYLVRRMHEGGRDGS